VVVVDRSDPITRGLPARFATRDESYRFTSRPRAHVLLAADARGRPPLAWTKRYGRGRVFYDALGHPIAAWSDPVRDGIVARGLAWAVRRS
jgi:hypothetical protein